MTTIDPEQERQRLTKLYEGMNEGELQQIAGDADSLTDVAVQTLAYELKRRGLEIAIATSSVPIEKIEQRELVCIRKFRDLPEAHLAKGRLDSEGIECFLVDDNMANYVGVRLAVKEDDAEEALAVLEESVPETFDVEGEGE